MKKLLLGFDLGGTKLASGVVSLNGQVMESKKDSVDFNHGVNGFLLFLEKVGQFWLKKYPTIKILGIASCGPLDVKKGILLQPTNFPRWGNISVASYLSQKLKISVFMQNDAAAVAGAEGWVGGAQRLKNWMSLTLGTGLGTGVVINRKIFMGGSGFGPEAGHFIITDKPYLCGCGNQGCAEALLSGTALWHRIQEKKHLWKTPPQNPKDLVACALKKDQVSLQIFKEYSEFLARAIHNYAVVFMPETIFFSGGVSEAQDLFLPQTTERLITLLKNRPGYMPKLCVSKLTGGFAAGAHTAGMCARSASDNARCESGKSSKSDTIPGGFAGRKSDSIQSNAGVLAGAWVGGFAGRKSDTI